MNLIRRRVPLYTTNITCLKDGKVIILSQTRYGTPLTIGECKDLAESNKAKYVTRNICKEKYDTFVMPVDFFVDNSKKIT